MKLRLMGTMDEINWFLGILGREEYANKITVRSVSSFYPNRPPSIEGRVYVEID